MNPIPSYKILLVGDGGVGKTTFLKRAVGEVFDPRYVATLGVEVHPVLLGGHANVRATFNVWDCAGQERFAGLGQGYYAQAHAVIFAFDLTSHFTYRSLAHRMQQVREVTGDIPFMIIGMKADLPRDPELERVQVDQHFEISAKMAVDVEDVFGHLLTLL